MNSYLNVQLVFYTFLIVGILSLFIWLAYKFGVSKEKLILYFITCLSL